MEFGAVPVPLKTVSVRLGMSIQTVRRLVGSGDLVAYRVRRSWRVYESDFQAFLASRSNQRKAAAA